MKQFLVDWIRGFDWRKILPGAVVWVMYVVLYFIFISALGMFVAMFLGKFDMTKEQIAHSIPIIGQFMIFYSPPSGNHYFMLVSTAILTSSAWLFSTRLKMCTSSILRRKMFFGFVVLTGAVVYNVFASNFLKPITYDKVMLLDTFVTGNNRKYVHVGALHLLGTTLIMIPEIITYMFLNWLLGAYRQDKVIQDWFADYKFEWKYLARFGEEMAMKFPDITLALEALSRVPIVMMGVTRQLGTFLIGPPGSGKTSLKILKVVRQDLEHMQKMINAFPQLVKQYGLNTPEFLKELGKHLIGMVVIEPSKDLCDKSYSLAKEHGIPDKLIVYLDPSNRDTPGINTMIGPIEQVAETITAVLDGMSEVSNEFFRQACRTVLKQYIYLLKFLKKNECTLLDLDQMYQDPRFTKNMVEEVRGKVPEQEEIKRMPRDMQIYWMLVSRTIRWFDNDGLEEEKDREGMLQKFTSGEYKGQIKIKDKQTEFTRQTRNLLADLITNPYLARILTGKNAVDLDKLMAKGGILLCNTDNGLLGNVSDAFGKLVLMSVQNAVFRRKGDEDTRPLIAVDVDEFYDYMNAPFLKLAGQGRKYKIAIMVACQSLSQFKVKFDEAFVDAMIGTIRNYIVYGGVGQYDAKKLVPIFGTHVVEEVSIRENYTPESAANPSFSYGQTITREEKELVTEDEIMFNKFKFSYIRLVIEGSTAKAVKGEGDFVDMGNSKKWKKALKPAAVKEFMRYWQDDDDIVYTFDMNWIDSSGEFVDPNTKDPSADLEMQIQNGRLAPIFEEMEKPEDYMDRFVSLSLSETKDEMDVTVLVDVERIREDEIEKEPLPRASQIAYGKRVPGETRTVEGENTKTMKKSEDSLPHAPSKSESPSIQVQEMKSTPVTKIEQSPSNDVVNFSSLFGSIQSKAPVPQVNKPEVNEIVNDQKEIEADVLQVQEEPAIPEPVVMDKKQRRLEHLKDVGIDASSKNFLKQVFKITKDTE
ncbi:type IV secretory system conjugative DNA transfer family protein [Paenibacillus agricola]|uniref:TraM recognition domain-containing protein n=1 Tax=Paenibacillus agricola TaxID=2716264 RepID=A0ABX0JHZ3_9BACL|nr:TraM recognition domain-containing protein [Paenibacillus agricola]NHN33360.1 TraM recognition domain-containing protein [Paenibacillus agricola]